METYGFLRVAAAVPALKLADPQTNAERHLALLKEAEARGVRLVVFPECSLTGYTCGDLFHQDALLNAAEQALLALADASRDFPLRFVVGLPLRVPDGKLFNCAAVVADGKVEALIPKIHLPTYREFYDARYFASGSLAEESFHVIGKFSTRFGTNAIYCCGDYTLGVEICEDLWGPNPPSGRQAARGATVLVNLSASNETIGKSHYRRQLVLQQSARCIAGYVYAGSGPGESTSDLVFGGHSIIAENGVLLAESTRFSRTPELLVADIDWQHLAHDRHLTGSFHVNGPVEEIECVGLDTIDAAPASTLDRVIDPHPFVPGDPATLKERCDEIFHIQTAALARRLEAANVPNVSIGVSGGLDSTLALLVLCKTLDLIKQPRSKILGFTLPGFGTTARTKTNAWALINALGVSGREIDIRGHAFEQMKALGHKPFGIALDRETLESFAKKLTQLPPEKHSDLVFENTQARARTSLLMNAGFVLGTGDLSELALGWCTYNADHMSMYNVNVGIPKTLVRFLVKWVAENEFDGDVRKTLRDVADTVISPELLPTAADGSHLQNTEDAVGPYELVDFFLYHLLRWGSTPAKILFLAKQARFDREYGEAELKKWLTVFLKRFFANQFKRNCLPDGPKVGSVAISPRGDWRMPSDASVQAWLNGLE